jgi:hypothetical protein
VVLVLLALAVLRTMAMAGDLNPPGAPGPTMKTLDQIPPSWDQILPANDGGADGCNSTRFKCAMGGEAVLDKETGLVWKRYANTGPVTFVSATNICLQNIYGGRYGWRLPTFQELSSLVDPAQSSPALPDGHPFLNVQLGRYWTTTTPSTTTQAWVVDLGSVSNLTIINKTGSAYVWCVRGGGHGLEVQ